MSINKKNSDGSYSQFAGMPYVTKDNLGIEKVENKSSEDIRGEITSKNIKDALGYTPANDVDEKKSQNDIAVLSSRMDGFTKLGEGSTTGDAELEDIRVAYDGKTYSNAGTAVRSQVTELKETIKDLEQKGYPMASITDAVNYWVSENHESVVNNYVTPESFGAKGDGITDDTEALQNALDSAADNITLKFTPNKKYMVNYNGVYVKSNTVVDFNGAALAMIANDKRQYAVLHINQAENVKLINPHVAGDKPLHTDTGGEWGMGISIISSHDIEVYNAVVWDCWGDAIYIGSQTETTADTSYNIVFNGITVCKNCRRQGISITSGHDIVFDILYAEDIRGTAPEAVLDIESNNSASDTYSISINQITAKRCGGAIYAVARGNKVSANIGNVYAIDCYNNAVGFSYSEVGDTTDSNKGTYLPNINNAITIDNLYVNKALSENTVKLRGILHGVAPSIYINNITIDEIVGTYNHDLVYFRIDRMYEYRKHGRVFIGEIKVKNAEAAPRCFTSSNAQSIDLTLHLEDIRVEKMIGINCDILRLVANNCDTKNVFFGIENKDAMYKITEANEYVHNGLNILENRIAHISEIMESATIYNYKNTYVTFRLAARFSQYKIYINDVEKAFAQQLSNVFDMMTRTINVFINHKDQEIRIYYSNYTVWNQASTLPSNPVKAQTHFYNNKPVWYDGTNWIDAMGTVIK